MRVSETTDCNIKKYNETEELKLSKKKKKFVRHGEIREREREGSKVRERGRLIVRALFYLPLTGP